jgi:Major Vault Protein repeat domain
MKKWIVVCSIALFLTPSPILGDQKPNAETDAQRINRELVGTWDGVLPGNVPRAISLIKHVTPTHYTWVTYDREKNAILAVAGGTWSVQDGKYREVCEFATEDHRNVRGKTFTFTMTVSGDKWDLKGVPGTGTTSNDAWNRLKPQADQKTNTGQRGRELIGTWETDLGPNVPKSGRMVKHVTPTYWTWVIYDRDSQRVMAAMGGPWSLVDGKYEETVAFTTDNTKGARSQSFPYGFRVDGDRWLIERGPGQAAGDEVWKRVK